VSHFRRALRAARENVRPHTHPVRSFPRVTWQRPLIFNSACGE
jgi:hypothetical protein